MAAGLIEPQSQRSCPVGHCGRLGPGCPGWGGSGLGAEGVGMKVWAASNAAGASGRQRLVPPRRLGRPELQDGEGVRVSQRCGHPGTPSCHFRGLQPSWAPEGEAFVLLH